MGRHVLFETGIRRLGSKERGFFYRYPGTGETVREERVLTRIENLRVPPAWEDARIARSPSARVQAIGFRVQKHRSQEPGTKIQESGVRK